MEAMVWLYIVAFFSLPVFIILAGVSLIVLAFQEDSWLYGIGGVLFLTFGILWGIEIIKAFSV